MSGGAVAIMVGLWKWEVGTPTGLGWAEGWGGEWWPPSPYGEGAGGRGDEPKGLIPPMPGRAQSFRAYYKLIHSTPAPPLPGQGLFKSKSQNNKPKYYVQMQHCRDIAGSERASQPTNRQSSKPARSRAREPASQPVSRQPPASQPAN